MLRHLSAAAPVLLAALLAQAADPELLFHWRFDEGSGSVAGDASGNGLDGAVTANWVGSPSGSALFFDGTPATQVQINLPEGKRLGTGSWTFAAWVKPEHLGMEGGEQNVRRIFSYGPWPGAHIVMDIGAKGNFSCFMCYTGADGKRVDSGGSSAPLLKVGEWAHVVMVCDRENGQVRPYVNGVAQDARSLPAGFAGNYNAGGNLSVGSGWQNFWGAMDEV
ncbi:MAG: LamG-like jellyroll fold domain-containing protein, partial [Lentisphaeria bacterium]|nr:LamG-like jellyroll fold domain-containing protein [Lentisphaeria bacterium]